MSCILCGNSPINLFEIKDYTRDDIVEIFGARNEICIEENQLICKPCQKLLEKLAQLKRRLRYLILRPSEDRKPVDLKHIWKLFASFQLDKEDKEKRSIPTPNPSILFTVSDCEDFSENHSRSSKGRPKRKTEKKKGHGWTRRKRSSSSASVATRGSTRLSTRASTRASTRTSVATPFTTLSGYSTYDSSRPNTPYSDISYLSGYSRRSRRRAALARMNETNNVLVETFDTNIFYCPDKKCSLYYMNVDLLNYHIKHHHKSALLFYCTECDASFSLEQHLKIHTKIHDFYPFFCLLCAEPQENRVQLQSHLDQHMFFSIPCTYCDKTFLAEEQLNAHHKIEHYKKRKNKIITQKKSILKKIVYDKNITESAENRDFPHRQDFSGENQENNMEDSNQRTESVNNNSKLHSFLKKDYIVCIAPQLPEELEVTMENLILKNVNVYRGDGYDASEDKTHLDTWQDEITTIEEDTRNYRSEMEIIVSEGRSENNQDEEMEMRQDTNSDLDKSRTMQPLVNGFSDSNESEAMDIVSDDECHRPQEDPS